MFAGEQFGQFLHIRLDQFLVAEHHARALLRIGRRPFRLHLERVGNSTIEQLGIAKRDLRLHFPRRRVPYLMLASRCAGRTVSHEMFDLTHVEFTPSKI